MEKMEKKTSMPIVNLNSAGIDVGSKSHFIAVGQKDDDVQEFDVTTKGHQDAISFLKRHHVKTIAMESTGPYWQTIYFILQEAGFEVVLVSGSQTKNVKKNRCKRLSMDSKTSFFRFIKRLFFTKYTNLKTS